jgi:hypothetical protein
MHNTTIGAEKDVTGREHGLKLQKAASPVDMRHCAVPGRNLVAGILNEHDQSGLDLQASEN